MPPAATDNGTDTPLVAILARVHAGELPLAMAIPALAGCPAAAPVLDRFRGDLRRMALPPNHPLPWAAVCYGLDSPEHCARRDVARAERWVAQLRALTPARRRHALQLARDKAENPALIDALIAEARRALDADPHEALAWLDLASYVIHRLSAVGFPEPLLYPSTLRLAAHRANAHRVAGDLPEADRHFRELATKPCRRDLARLEIEAELLSLEASLRIDLRQFEEADELLGKAADYCQLLGEPRALARVLLQRGGAAYYAGDPERAVEYERSASELLSPDSDRKLYLMSRQNTADTLTELGRTAEAATILSCDAEFAAQVEDSTFRLRWRWIEARLARAENRHEVAERLLLEVRDGWLAHHHPYDAALATLDLAELALARGDWQHVRTLAAMLIPIFEARGVHREAQAALILFQQAAEAARLTTEFLTRLRRYLHFAPRDPRLRFDPAASTLPAG